MKHGMNSGDYSISEKQWIKLRNKIFNDNQIKFKFKIFIAKKINEQIN